MWLQIIVARLSLQRTEISVILTGKIRCLFLFGYLHCIYFNKLIFDFVYFCWIWIISLVPQLIWKLYTHINLTNK